MFRLTINDNTINENAGLLGDRTLAAWVGKDILAFSTYTYSDMNGSGEPNAHQPMPYKD